MPWYQRLWEWVLSRVLPVRPFAPPPKPAPMTWQEADLRAKSWWGDEGWAAEVRHADHPCRVGEGEHMWGWGKTYPEAFLMARVNHPPRKGGLLP